jgi:hypothetical protein
MILSRYRDPWWHSVHHRDTLVPNRPWPSPTFPTVLEVSVGNGEWQKCHDDGLWVTHAKNGNGTVTGQNQKFLLYFFLFIFLWNQISIVKINFKFLSCNGEGRSVMVCNFGRKMVKVRPKRETQWKLYCKFYFSNRNWFRPSPGIGFNTRINI